MTQLENKNSQRKLGSFKGRSMYLNALLAVSFIFLLIGILFYVSWSILYGTWLDPGLYSFVVPMIVFGIIGIFYVYVWENP
jgi:hypothetical protein